MNTLAAFSITPLGQGEHLARKMAPVLNIIKESGLSYKFYAMFTEVEGPYDDVMALIKECAKEIADQDIRTEVFIKLDIKPGEENLMESKITHTEQALEDMKNEE